MTSAFQLFFPKQGVASTQEKLLLPLQPDQVLVKARYSGISRGTERLVFNAMVPRSQWETMKCPHQEGEFSFPVSYGYANVGVVVALGSAVDSLALGDHVFALYPHHTHYILQADQAIKIPPEVRDDIAVLSANMETALNAIWDAQITGSDTVLIIGAGVVGLLTAYLAAKEGVPVKIADVDLKKQAAANALGLELVTSEDVANDPETFSLIFNTSAAEAGLQMALDNAALEGRVVEMSWYGNKKVSLELGGAFHSKRLRIISSQVGMVAAPMRDQFTHRQRLASAMNYLADERLEHLLHPRLPFREAPDALCSIFDPESDALCPLIVYE